MWAPACESRLCPNSPPPGHPRQRIEDPGAWSATGGRPREELGRDWKSAQGRLIGNCSFPGTRSVVYRWGDGKHGLQGAHRHLMLLWGAWPEEGHSGPSSPGHPGQWPQLLRCQKWMKDADVIEQILGLFESHPVKASAAA